MPARNVIKDYVANAFYHLYNRGAAKMQIFREKEDYVVFIHYLKLALSPVEFLEEEFRKLEQQQGDSLVVTKESPWLNQKQDDLRRNKLRRFFHAINQAYRIKLHKDLELLSFCLKPTHFHR